MTTFYLHQCVEDLKRIYEFQQKYKAGEALSTELPFIPPKTYQAVLPVGEISALCLGPGSSLEYNDSGYPFVNGFSPNNLRFSPTNPNANAFHDNIEHDIMFGTQLSIGKNELSVEYIYDNGEEETPITVPITFNLIPEENHGPVTMTNFNPGNPL